MTNNKKGFTLIELLVVIAIIGILSAIGLVSLNGAREKARDAKRQADVASIKSGIALYYDDQSPAQYPCSLTLTATSPSAGVIWQALSQGTTKYLAAIPTATTIAAGTAAGTGDYYYISDGSGAPTLPATNCTGTTAQAYAFAVKMEGGSKLLYVLNYAGYGGAVAGSTSWNTLANFECIGSSSAPTATKMSLCQSTPVCTGTCAN